MHQQSDLGKRLRKGSQNGHRPGCLLAPFWRPFSIKNLKNAIQQRQREPNGAKSLKKRHLKIHAKNDTEKEAKIMLKGFQNDAKMDAEIDEKSMRFRNL